MLDDRRDRSRHAEVGRVTNEGNVEGIEPWDFSLKT
jgi:hypothetical protein